MDEGLGDCGHDHDRGQLQVGRACLTLLGCAIWPPAGSRFWTCGGFFCLCVHAQASPVASWAKSFTGTCPICRPSDPIRSMLAVLPAALASLLVPAWHKLF